MENSFFFNLGPTNAQLTYRAEAITYQFLSYNQDESKT
jgi:hypothetical protein